MIFRINSENYIYHMIDYFTRDELINLSYLIISAKIRHQGTFNNAIKCNDLYPSTDIISNHIQLGDEKLFHKMYYRELKDIENIVYTMIVNLMLVHRHNLVLICDKDEDLYIDVLCDFLQREFGISVVDLNNLFEDGETDVFYIDRTLIKNKSVELKRNVVRDRIKAQEQTEDGRAKLLSMMTKEDKLKKLKELGIKVNKSDSNTELTELLRLEWVVAGDD